MAGPEGLEPDQVVSPPAVLLPQSHLENGVAVDENDEGSFAEFDSNAGESQGDPAGEDPPWSGPPPPVTAATAEDNGGAAVASDGELLSLSPGGFLAAASRLLAEALPSPVCFAGPAGHELLLLLADAAGKAGPPSLAAWAAPAEGDDGSPLAALRWAGSPAELRFLDRLGLTSSDVSLEGAWKVASKPQAAALPPPLKGPAAPSGLAILLPPPPMAPPPQSSQGPPEPSCGGEASASARGAAALPAAAVLGAAAAVQSTQQAAEEGDSLALPEAPPAAAEEDLAEPAGALSADEEWGSPVEAVPPEAPPPAGDWGAQPTFSQQGVASEGAAGGMAALSLGEEHTAAGEVPAIEQRDDGPASMEWADLAFPAVAAAPAAADARREEVTAAGEADAEMEAADAAAAEGAAAAAAAAGVVPPAAAAEAFDPFAASQGFDAFAEAVQPAAEPTELLPFGEWPAPSETGPEAEPGIAMEGVGSSEEQLPAQAAAAAAGDWGSDDAFADFAQAPAPADSPAAAPAAEEAADGLAVAAPLPAGGADGAAAALEAILARVPDLSFMLSDSIVQP